MPLHHANFHTVRNLRVFEHPDYDAMVRMLLVEAFQRHRVLCGVWEVMPTHVHLIVADFPDFTSGTIVGRIKGSVSHSFFRTYPFLREELLGGHLWSKGYFAALIKDHKHYCAAAAYIQANRANAGLECPSPLRYFE